MTVGTAGVRPAVPDILIPAGLLPADGRFGSGPSKVRPEALAGLAATGASWLGTSHRAEPVMAVVRRIREGLVALFGLPPGWEVVLGNGGATAFWDAAAFGLVRERAQHLVLGEFSAKFAAVTAGAPFLAAPSVVRSEPFSAPTPRAEAGVDAYSWPHNETSTGVTMPVRRLDGADPGALMLVDATSAAAGLPVDVAECDAYYFSPQKGLASDGGLWVALLSPAALGRVAELAGDGSGRWVPPSLDLAAALTRSRADQTVNTPALATLWLLADSIEWLIDRGGLRWSTARCAESAAHLYGWAGSSSYASCAVADPSLRSAVVGTIDLDPAVDAAAVRSVLRANGIVDTDPYRGIGGNQLRIGMFPAVDPADVAALTACVDHVVQRLGEGAARLEQPL